MIDFFSADFRRNPFPVYDRIRPVSPVVNDPRSDFWIIFDYDGVKQALTDHEHFSSNMYRAGRGNPEWLIFFDPPRQTKQRALINRAFTSRAVAELEPRIRKLSRELLDKVVDRGEMDIAGEYAAALPMMVISEMIGIPAAEWPRFRRWSDIILKLSYSISAGSAANAATAEYFGVVGEMNAYMPELIEWRRSAPKDDLLTRLVLAEVDGDHLSDHEIIGFVQLLIVAGQETTSNLISNAVLCFMEHPDQFARLVDNPGLLPSAIEEVMRYRSPIQWMFRATTTDVPMHGQVIPAGKLVLPMIGSANHDPKQFAGPERFDIAREPNPHIAFGHGIHFCVGAPLARLEAWIALADIMERLKEFEPASSEPWQPRDALHVYGPTKLPIRFKPGRCAAAPA